MAGKLRVFYLGDQPVTLINEQKKTQLFRSGSMPLAQATQHLDLNTLALLGCDAIDSVIGSIPSSTQSRGYTAYGYSKTIETIAQGFAGQLNFFLQGIYYSGNGVRLFSPTLMRFYNPDISYSPFGAGDINCYGYCSGDPINYSDPSGFMKRSPSLKLQKPAKGIKTSPSGSVTAPSTSASQHASANSKNTPSSALKPNVPPSEPDSQAPPPSHTASADTETDILLSWNFQSNRAARYLTLEDTLIGRQLIILAKWAKTSPSSALREAGIGPEIARSNLIKAVDRKIHLIRHPEKSREADAKPTTTGRPRHNSK